MSSKNDQPYKGKATLSVLFGDDEVAEPTAEKLLSIESIELPSSQPRRYFDSQAMQALVQSVKTDGILQPLLVRPLGEEKYELVAGERRYRAAKEVGLTEVPVIIRDLTQQQALRVALVENLQREDLNPVEETEGILQLLSHHLEYDLEEVVRLLYRMQNDVQRMNDNVIIHHEMQIVLKVFSEVGRMSWESFVSNRLGLLKLPSDIQEALRRGQIEYTKARAIAKVKDEQARKSLLEAAIAECLSLTQINTTSPKICNNKTQARKDDCMKVNYPERIEDTVSELKIIMSQQRTVTNRQKVQALYLLKSGLSQSITNVAEVLGVHRITVQRWFKQYSEEGLSSLLKLGKSTGRPRVISSEIIAGISTKINAESCEFKSYKEIARWVEENYQVSVKYQTLHKQVRYRMKAKLKVPRRLSNKKDPAAAIEFKKN
jgi:ParB family chromosome partitioning protein